MMKTRIYILLAAMLLTVASVQAQDKTATTISVDAYSPIYAGNDANVGVTLNADINAIATLTVTDGASYNKSFYVALIGGNGSYYVPNLAVGTYSITASFAGNDQYAASTSDAQTLEVNKVPTTLTLSLDENEIVRTKEIYVGDFPFLKCTLDQSINGVFNLTVNGENHVEGFVNGKYTYERHTGGFKVSWVPDYFCNFYNLPAGTYTYKATYAGNDKYEGSESDEVTLTVLKNPTAISVAEITTPITEGQDAAITVNMTPSDTSAVATLTVTNSDNSYNETFKVAVFNGTGTCYIPNLTAGEYDVTASFAGNFKYDASSTETAKTLTVNAGNPIVESNSVVTVTLDQEITKVATVTVGNATYYVPVVNGTGTLTLPQQVAGTHNVQAQFIEDGQYAASTSDETQLVSVPGITFPFAANQEWATWCDDWAWKKPEGVTAYTISAVNGNTVTISEVTGDNIPSHTPLLLKKTDDAVTPTKVITGSGTDALVSKAATGATFWGNASDAKINTGYSYAYGNSYGLYNGEFVLIDTDNGIAANRCMLTLGGNTGAPKLSISTDVTGVEEVVKMGVESGVKMDDSWYTLDGRKLEGMPTKKGIYINNGIKVVIK